MGRVGFMSEIDADDALDGVGWYVEGNARVERRAMLQVEILGSDDERLEPPVDALNDLVVRRGDGLGILDGWSLPRTGETEWWSRRQRGPRGTAFRSVAP